MVLFSVFLMLPAETPRIAAHSDCVTCSGIRPTNFMAWNLVRPIFPDKLPERLGMQKHRQLNAVVDFELLEDGPKMKVHRGLRYGERIPDGFVTKPHGCKGRNLPFSPGQHLSNLWAMDHNRAKIVYKASRGQNLPPVGFNGKMAGRGRYAPRSKGKCGFRIRP